VRRWLKPFESPDLLRIVEAISQVAQKVEMLKRTLGLLDHSDAVTARISNGHYGADVQLHHALLLVAIGLIRPSC
jgi:hypothetical protein